MLEQKRNGPKVPLTKLNIEGNKSAEAILYTDQKCSRKIGYVTSAIWSPAVKANIALTMINTAALKGEIWVEIYYQRELRYHHKVAPCTIQSKLFWSIEKARLTPPGIV